MPATARADLPRSRAPVAKTIAFADTCSKPKGEVNLIVFLSTQSVAVVLVEISTPNFLPVQDKTLHILAQIKISLDL